jgi:hypothetical protein
MYRYLFSTGRRWVRITTAAKDFLTFSQLGLCKNADMKVSQGQEFGVYKLGK